MPDNYNILDDPPASGGVLSDPLTTTFTPRSWDIKEVGSSALPATEPGTPQVTFNISDAAYFLGVSGAEGWTLTYYYWLIVVVRNDSGGNSSTSVVWKKNGVSQGGFGTTAILTGNYGTQLFRLGAAGLVNGDVITLHMYYASGSGMDFTGYAALKAQPLIARSDPQEILADVTLNQDYVAALTGGNSPTIAQTLSRVATNAPDIQNTSSAITAYTWGAWKNPPSGSYPGIFVPAQSYSSTGWVSNNSHATNYPLYPRFINPTSIDFKTTGILAP